MKLQGAMKKRDLRMADVRRACVDRGMTASHSTLKRWIIEATESPRFDQMVVIAGVLELSLDYLGDDEVDNPAAGRLTGDEARILELARKLTPEATRVILENCVRIGVDEALDRLLQVHGQPEGASLPTTTVARAG